MKSTTENILDYLKIRKIFGYPHPPVTATVIAEALLCKTRLSSVSSLLKKLSDQGKVFRTKKIGPRGGYGYYVRKIK